MIVRIPMCPPAELSPNARVEWREHVRWKRFYRDAACLSAFDELNRTDGADIPVEGPVAFRVTIGWAKGRKAMDPDNAVAILKYAIDGVAKALGIDDGRMAMDGPVVQVRDETGYGYTEFEIMEVV